jgi:hypothetical protein
MVPVPDKLPRNRELTNTKRVDRNADFPEIKLSGK